MPGAPRDFRPIWDETLDLVLERTFRFIGHDPVMLKQGEARFSTCHGRGMKPPLLFRPCVPGGESGRDYADQISSGRVCKAGHPCAMHLSAGILTPPVQEMLKDPRLKRYSRASIDGRLGQPEEVAEAAIYFASDESRWTTGSILPSTVE